MLLVLISGIILGLALRDVVIILFKATRDKIKQLLDPEDPPPSAGAVATNFKNNQITN